MKKSIFILGDSICIYYSPYLLPLLENDFECQTKKGRAEAMKNLDVPISANAGNTRDILKFLDLEREHNNITYDYLVFNTGLHDLVYLVNKETGELRDRPSVSLSEYKTNLNKILDIMKEFNVKPIFMTTTPVEDERHNTRVAFHRHGADVIKYNEAAASVMAEREIPIIDLFKFTNELEGEKFLDHVHYLEEVAEKQAQFINTEFRKIVEKY